MEKINEAREAFWKVVDQSNPERKRDLNWIEKKRRIKEYIDEGLYDEALVKSGWL